MGRFNSFVALLSIAPMKAAAAHDGHHLPWGLINGMENVQLAKTFFIAIKSYVSNKLWQLFNEGHVAF